MRITADKKILLGIIIGVGIVAGLALVPFASDSAIPPTIAFVNFTTDSGSIQADSYRGIGSIVGDVGITVTANPLTDTITINNTGVTMLAGGIGNLTASYVVATNTTHYSGINGTTGQIDFINTDFSTLMDNIIDEIGKTGRGGSIFIKAGQYVIESEIDIDVVGIEIIGEGSGINDDGVTELIQANNVNQTYLLDFVADAGKLRHIALDGNKANNPVISIAVHVLGNHFRGNDIFLENSGGPNLLVSGHEHQFDTVYSRFSDEEGMQLSNVFSSRFANFYTSLNEKSGILASNNVRRNEFVNFVSNGDNRDGIRLQGSGGAGAVADYNSFTNLVFQAQVSGTGEHAINLQGAQHNFFTNVQIYDFITKTTNTYNGINVESIGGRHSVHNVFDNVNVIHSGDLSTITFKYGINEADVLQTHNTYRNIFTNGPGTGHTNILGLQSTLEGVTPEQDIATTKTPNQSTFKTINTFVGKTITMPSNETNYQITHLEIQKGTSTINTNVTIAAFLVEANPTVTDRPLQLVAVTEQFTVPNANQFYKKPTLSKMIPAGSHLFLGFNTDISAPFMRENPATTGPGIWTETYSENPETNRSVTLTDIARTWYVKAYFKGYE